MIIFTILLYAYLAVIVCLCIFLAGLFVLAGVIGATAVLMAPFRRPRAAPAGSEPLWRSNDCDAASEILDFHVRVKALGQHPSTYTFEHDGPRIAPDRIQEN